MNKSDNIYPDILPRLYEGVRKATSIVSKTMGPKGRNVEIQRNLYPFHEITNDGSTIIKAIELADPIESIGLTHLKEAADRSNNNSGDGSTTTSVLLDAILSEGLKTRNNTLEIKESLDACLPIIEKSIKEQTKEITVTDIPSVAKIAGEDDELAKVLGDIYAVIGKDGIIHLEGSGTYDTSYTLIEGVRFFDTGYLSEYMVYDEDAEKEGRRAKKSVHKNPKVLITKNKISSIKDIDPILQTLIASNVKSLVIFTHDMDSNVARALIELQKNPARSINVLIVKAPTLWKNYVYEDFAKITGATIIEDSSGTALGNKFRLDWLGTCETLVCDKEEMTVIGIKDISDHIADLKAEDTNDAKLRLSWLTTKTAILRLGAKSETELSWRRLKAEDAIFSSRLALKNGVVAGGGLALYNASELMPDTIGGNILRKALKAPLYQVTKNANIESSTFEGKIGGVIGVDASSGEVKDMLESGIIDAASIVVGAAKNSLGIASTLLTTSSVVTIPPPTTEELIRASGMRNMPF